MTYLLQGWMFVDVGEGPLPLIRECGQSLGTDERGKLMQGLQKMDFQW